MANFKKQLQKKEQEETSNAMADANLFSSEPVSSTVSSEPVVSESEGKQLSLDNNIIPLNQPSERRTERIQTMIEKSLLEKVREAAKAKRLSVSSYTYYAVKFALEHDSKA